MFQAANTKFHSDILVFYVIFNKKLLIYFIHLLDMDMTVNGGYILLLYSRFLLSNNLLFNRTKGYHGSKKFTEKLYASAICTPKKTIPNLSPSNVRAVRTPSATRIVLTLYVIFPANTFFSKTISHICITVLLIRKKIREDSLIITDTKLLTYPLGITIL